MGRNFFFPLSLCLFIDFFFFLGGGGGKCVLTHDSVCSA